VGWWARFFTGAGFLLHTASIGAHSSAMGGTPLTGTNQLILASWALVLLYFVIEHLIRIRIYGAFLVPVALVLLVATQLIGGPSAGYELPAEQLAQVDDWRIGFHVALIVFANAGFAFAAVSAALYLYQTTQLKRHHTSRISRRLPSLATLQTVTRRAVALSFPVYTAGLLLGVVRAMQVDVQLWWLDPRIMVSGVAWSIYAVFLIMVYRKDVSLRTSSVTALVGFAVVVVIAILARTLPTGFHIFGL
jgi:ABC-type transport system involved in cytochrome c biogenesis permease subunit